jgi:hypothetical protein
MAPWNLVNFFDNSQKRTALIFIRQSKQAASKKSACLAYDSTLKMEALRPSMPSVDFYQNTRRHIQETE